MRLWLVMGKSVYSQMITQDRLCSYTITQNEAPSCSHFWSGKAKFITYSEGVFVDLLIQHAKRMHRIVFSSVACAAPLWLLQPEEEGTNDAKIPDGKNLRQYFTCLINN